VAHNVEIIDGKAQMAYSGEVPWHGLGTEVPADLTPEQMLEAAGLNWEVEKVPAYSKVGSKNIDIGWSALVRKTDEKVIDVVSNDWKPVQNLEAFEFFNDFIAEGEMEMHTAGSLQGGQIVWALAKVKDGFSLFGGDEVESYLHFTNFHKYGFSTDVRFTPIRVVCNNTLTLSLNTKVERMVKISHRNKFNGDDAKLMLGIAADKLAKYEEMAQFLGTKRYTDETVTDFFNRIWPKNENAKRIGMTKNSKDAVSILETQPGADFAPGTWWQAYNAVTYMTDHIIGRNADNRMQSAWYGNNKNLKVRALETAVEMAEAA
jgi:phage/plasmid-like protein (TIGR03299 family)